MRVLHSLLAVLRRALAPSVAAMPLLLAVCDRPTSDPLPVGASSNAHAPAPSPAPSLSPTPAARKAMAAAPPPATPTPECLATNGAQSIELALTWDRNIAKGTLRTDDKSQPVIAEMYKGLVLVDLPDAKPISGKLATVTTEGKKTIRLGDYKQPSFDCK